MPVLTDERVIHPVVTPGWVQPVERVSRVWVVPVRGVGSMGEEDSARCLVDILPAERACQGWQTLVLQA